MAYGSFSSRLTCLGASVVLLAAGGCGGSGGEPARGSEGAEEGPRVHGLTPAEAGQVLARVGDREITVGDFAEELASLGAFIRPRYTTPERRRELLEKMIELELLAQEAERRGYFDLPEVQRARKQAMVQRLIEERRGAVEEAAIEAEEVEAYYAAHRDDFRSPAQVRASHIVLADGETARRVLDEVRRTSGIDGFRRLAREHSIDAGTRASGGDLGFFSRPGEEREGEPSIPDEVREAAFAIEAQGGVAEELIRTEAGYHIVMLTARRAARDQDLASVERIIRNRLQRERQDRRMEELLARLRAQDDVEQDLSLLDQVRLPEVPGGDGDEP
ncbi:MAG: peptidyl-prolyl cis-trans isomerase [Sandaracinaceae bacterium]